MTEFPIRRREAPAEFAIRIGVEVDLVAPVRQSLGGDKRGVRYVLRQVAVRLIDLHSKFIPRVPNSRWQMRIIFSLIGATRRTRKK